MSLFQDKVVIITGASSGIGACTAIQYAKNGASVVLVARNMERLQDTAEKCRQAGATEDRVLIIPANVTNEAKVQQIAQDTVQKFGKINILVNNAGGATMANMQTTTTQSLEEDINLNCKSAFLMIQACLPHLMEIKGNIVNVSSIAGTRPFTSLFGYSVAKAALDQLTKCAALELAAKNVRVNAVSPGTIETPLFVTSKMVPKADYLPKFFSNAAPLTPLGRNGKVEEIASAILYLSSDEASFITGSNLFVDGGRSQHVASRI